MEPGPVDKNEFLKIALLAEQKIEKTIPIDALEQICLLCHYMTSKPTRQEQKYKNG